MTDATITPETPIEELARAAYHKEYHHHIKFDWIEDTLITAGAVLIGGGAVATTAIVFAAASLGWAALVPAAVLSTMAAVGGAFSLLTGALLASDRADHKIDEDIANGSLVARFKKEFMKQEDPAPAIAPPAVAGVTASADFNGVNAQPLETSAVPVIAAAPASPK